jgi:hypothetical protein
MKSTKVLVLIVLAMVAAVGSALAATVPFAMKATMPGASGVSIVAASGDSATGKWTSVTGSALTFGTLTFDSMYKIWRAPNFFAIDVANVGPGAPSVTISYTDATTRGLGNKASITLKKMTYVGANNNSETEVLSQRKLNSIAGGTSVSSSTLSGGWLRIYTGLNDGANITAGDPFTNADAPGDYTGTLTVSATPN